MAATQGRNRPVRLTDIPLHERLKAARWECRFAKTSKERAELLTAALFPSDTVYWVRAEAA